MRETLMFLGQVRRRWRSTGAVAPSGRSLARAMADAVGDVPDGKVLLELGPGTGVFTREMVRRFPKARLVAVEVNEVFAAHLARAYPTVTVVPGCASQLETHLAKLGIDIAEVSAVFSGLPLLTFPGDLPQRVLASIARVVPPGRPFIQFTYFEKTWRKYDLRGFRFDHSRRVWRNLPPAKVMTFTRQGGGE
jgi:phosphatidylethanolamine/phosphatidyl-N-methylethanolamine N-methyltransferase